MLDDAGRSEIVGAAPNREHERVVRKRALRGHDTTLLVRDARHVHEALLTIEPEHLADAIVEVMPVRLREIVEIVLTDVHAAGRDLVQQRLPEMRALLVYERDVRTLAL